MDPGQLSVRSCGQTSSVATTAPVTRGMAMAVPAVAKARHLLLRRRATSPGVVPGPTKDPEQPLWMQRTDGDLSPFHRMLWTVDDLLFYGWSLWAAKRGAPTDGSPLLGCCPRAV
jgi:hypothetical protein